MTAASLVWFRTDLRLADNPALSAAVAAGGPAACLYVLDDGLRRPPGGAMRWWLHHSLATLAGALAERGGALWLARGDPAVIVPRFAQALGAGRVFWNRRYGAQERALDARIKADLRSRSLEVESFNAALLREPWAVQTQGGTPFKVFTPFWRSAQALGPFAAPLPAPGRIAAPTLPSDLNSNGLDALALLPTRPDWAVGLRASWTPGEAGAAEALGGFLAGPLAGYASNRDRPDRTGTSRLSPHLAFGEIGPRQIVRALLLATDTGASAAQPADVSRFLAELGWREFSYHLLFHNPDLPRKNHQPKFDAFPWRSDPAALVAWQRGRTGYPIVDAGMRQLWQTGWMHNRVRMVVASFLIKHLLLDWRLGEAWFHDTLVDADPANNAASWQWVAGSGADAAPYYRIFNPMTQGETFDPDGTYVRTYVPELARLPAAHIHAPWQAPAMVLATAGVRLGIDYPQPLVDHAAARARALAAFKSLSA